MFLRHIQMLSRGRNRIHQFQMCCLIEPTSVPIPPVRIHAHHVRHSLKLDAASHTSRSPRLFYLVLVCVVQVPDGVIRMTEHPEVVAADIRELLQVCLVYPRYVELLDEGMR